jgi:glycosyltransferase involved in cell wall biosynthesis
MLVNLARGVSEQGVAVDFIVNRAGVPYLDALPSQVRVLELHAAGRLQRLGRLVAYLRRERPTVLLSAKGPDDRVAVRAKRLARVPTRVVLRAGTSIASRLEARGRDPIRRWLRYRVVRRLYHRADGIIAVSRGVAEELSHITQVPADRIRVIPNPTVTPELDRLGDEPVEHPWLVPGQPPLILGAGGLRRQKDFPTLIRAFALLRRERACRLLIIGEGRHRHRLEALASQLGVAKDVVLPGFVHNPYAYMKRARLFVLSSAWEGSPNALTEALALGLPVVATDCSSGPRELLQDGRYGRLVPVGDAEVMARAMRETLDAPPDPRWLRSAVTEYTVERSAQRYLEAWGLRSGHLGSETGAQGPVNTSLDRLP